MMVRRFRWSGWVLIGFLVACSAALQTGVIAFRPLEGNPNAIEISGMLVAAEAYDTADRMENTFGTDLRSADILPILLIAKNAGTHRMEIVSGQAFGQTAQGELVTTYSHPQAATRIRSSSAARKFASKVALGALAGAAAGAAIGAAVGGGTGAGRGAAIGGAIGGVGGGIYGASEDGEYHRISRELSSLSFGNRVVPSGNTELGFIWMKADQYTALRVKVHDATDNKTVELTVPVLRASDPSRRS
jgi:outer membrane lipoprotein SlyB